MIKDWRTTGDIDGYEHEAVFNGHPDAPGFRAVIRPFEWTDGAPTSWTLRVSRDRLAFTGAAFPTDADARAAAFHLIAAILALAHAEAV